jgi:hypothetical protein
VTAKFGFFVIKKEALVGRDSDPGEGRRVVIEGVKLHTVSPV